MTALMMACLPPALNVYVLAQRLSHHVAQASTIVLIGTLVSVTASPASCQLITHDLLPTFAITLKLVQNNEP